MLCKILEIQSFYCLWFWQGSLTSKKYFRWFTSLFLLFTGHFNWYNLQPSYAPQYRKKLLCWFSSLEFKAKKQYYKSFFLFLHVVVLNYFHRIPCFLLNIKSDIWIRFHVGVAISDIFLRCFDMCCFFNFYHFWMAFLVYDLDFIPEKKFCLLPKTGIFFYRGTCYIWRRTENMQKMLCK